jgi:hypothetical protein
VPGGPPKARLGNAAPARPGQSTRSTFKPAADRREHLGEPLAVRAAIENRLTSWRRCGREAMRRDKLDPRAGKQIDEDLAAAFWNQALSLELAVSMMASVNLPDAISSISLATKLAIFEYGGFRRRDPPIAA